MKPFLFAIVIASCFSSCEDQKSASREITSFVDTVDPKKEMHYADSLDLDTSFFITTNFPDTIHKVLYNGIDTLWAYVDNSFNQVDKKHKEFSRNKLKELLIDSDFTVDSSSNQQFATKRKFNKRYTVGWLTTEPDTITTQVLYWLRGRKYRLINQRWNSQD